MRVRRPLLPAAIGLLLGELLPEPPDVVHPVAWFGSAMRAVERRWWRDEEATGALHTAAGVGVAAALGALVDRLVPLWTQALATAGAVGAHGLDRAAADVATALERGDLDEARSLMPALVGRDPADLDVSEITRAVIESLAENTVDATVAPALWAAVAGPPGVIAYRAVNTLDAMVGHRSDRYRRYGWASARLDDVANFVPARVTAAAVVLVRPSAARQVWDAVRNDAPQHPSPNAGVAEAAFAAALGLRLGGTNRYGDVTEVRPSLGDGRAPDITDIAAARRLARDVGVVLAGALLAADAAAGVSVLMRRLVRR